ncbi:DnaJ family domain-containing protein [Cellulomonas sp. P5_E12]
MPEHDPVRDAARYRVDRDAAGDGEPQQADGPPQAAGRMANRHLWVDVVVDQAIARGEFDDLPLAGKPIPGIGAQHDPDWWLKALIAREQITGVLPEAIQLRKDDAVLLERLDALRTEKDVREALAELNARIVSARRQLMGGPPVVTPLRDVEVEVRQWHARRTPPPAPVEPTPPEQPRRRRWRRAR